MRKTFKQASLRRLPAFSVLFALLVLLFFGLQLTAPMELQVWSGGQLRYCAPYDQDQVEVVFRHSVNHGVIREIYRLDPELRQLALDLGHFESYGAGMLDTLPEEVKMHEEGDFLVLEFPLVFQKSITYRAGPIAGHRLIYGESQLRLSEIMPMEAFEIRLGPASVGRRLFGREIYKKGWEAL